MRVILGVSLHAMMRVGCLLCDETIFPIATLAVPLILVYRGRLRAFWTWASYIAYAVGIIAGYIGSCANKRRRRRTESKPPRLDIACHSRWQAIYHHPTQLVILVMQTLGFVEMHTVRPSTNSRSSLH